MNIFVFDRFLPGTIPSCISILMLIFLSALTIKAGKTQRVNQLFTIICLIQLIHQLSMTLATYMPSAANALFVYRTDQITYLFMLPVSVHYVHRALNLNYTTKVAVCMYGATLCILPFISSNYYISATQKGQYDLLPSAGPLFLFFIIMSIAVILIYTVVIIGKLSRSTGNIDKDSIKICLYILAGLLPAILLTICDALPLFGIGFYHASRFIFIPMGILTFGILHHQILDNKGWFSTGYIPNFLTAMVWLPALLGVLFCMTKGEGIIHPNIFERLFPAAIPPVLSSLVCFSLATFCFQKGSRQMQTMVFGGICTLWGFLNLDVTLLFIISDKHTALQMNRLDHMFLVMQLGFYVHFLHYFAGLRKFWVYLSYGTSLIFVPLTQTSLYLSGMYEYPWGLFAKKEVLFDIMISITLIEIIAGCIVLIRKIRTTSVSLELRKKYIYFICGAMFMALLGIANVPAMSGVDVYPFGSFMFIPVILMAYGIFKYDLVKINIYTRKRLWAETSALLTCIGYVLLAAICYVTLKPLSIEVVINKVVTSGLPTLISFCVCFFFSVLSLRVGHTLVGSRLFGLICTVYAFLSVDILLNSIVIIPEAGLRVSRLNHILLVMWPGLHIHLVYLICRKKDNKSVVLFYYTSGVFFTLFSQSPWYLSSIKHYHWGFFAQTGPLFNLFCLLAAVNVIYSLRLFYLAYRQQADPVEKQRLLLFSIGLGAAAALTAGNLPAMNGHDVYPPGNYICIPVAVFGYAMFRNLQKEALVLLNIFFYATGIACILFITSLLLYKTIYDSLAFGVIFVGIMLWSVMLKGYERISGTVLALFLGNQKKLLDQLFIRITDQLPKSRTLDDIVHHIAQPVFKELYVQRLSILFYSEESNMFIGGECRNNPAPGATDMCRDITLPQSHPLLYLFQKEVSAVTQEQVESWIINSEISIATDDILRGADIIQPVYSEGSLVSLILFYGKEDGSVYSDTEKEFISRIGFTLGPYIENAKLLQGLELEVEKRTGDLSAALNDITIINHFIKTANASLNPDDIMEAFLENPEPVFRFETIFIQLLDSNKDTINLYRVYGNLVSPEQKKQLESLSVPLKDTSSLSVKGMLTKKRVYRNRYLRDDNNEIFEDTIHSIIPFSSILILPMEIRSEVIGNILFLSGNEPFDFNDREIAKLQGYVTQAASAVNNARLYDKAEIAAKVKSEFLARMSHEIRSPLNAILGMGEILAETTLSEEQRKYIDIFMNSGELLLSVINDILDYSKIDANQTKLESIAFDLYGLVNGLRDIISAAAIKKGLCIDLTFSPEVSHHVCGDPVKLSQVIMNLADNAIKFTEKGGITIYVSNASKNSPPDAVQFCVEDTGIGIPEGKTSVIFESFSQEEISTTRKYGGTGLGLTISKKLIELMGGTISVTSDIGRGSRFYFSIPLPKATKKPEKGFSLTNLSTVRLKSLHDQSDHKLLSNRLNDLEPLSILLAEDIHTNILVIEQYLKSSQPVLNIASNGIEAVRMFQNNRYDLVLMDINMPHMDGYEATMRIREWERNNGLPETPVVALSAHAPDESKKHIIMEFQAFLMKPFSRHDLTETLMKHVNLAGNTGQAGKSPPDQPEKFTTLPVDPELIDIIPVLLNEITAELKTIELSLKQFDFSAASRLSHGFKGAAGNCGLEKLSDMFRELYELVENQDLDMSVSMISTIRSYVSNPDFFSDHKMSNQPALIFEH